MTLAATGLLCASCGEDPKLVEKHNRQQAEIARLKGEIALLEEKLKSMPPDVSQELETARKRSAEQSAAVAELEREVGELNQRKRALQSEFDSYRAKYQIK